MIKAADPAVIIGLIFDVMQGMACYKKYPSFQSMDREHYIQIILKRGIDSAYGVYKQNKLVGGAVIYDNAELHFAVFPNYGKMCGHDALILKEKTFKKFGKVIAKVEMDNKKYRNLLKKIGFCEQIIEHDANGHNAILIYRG